MTAPLVPPEVDLRDFAFMPLDVLRLRDSGLTAKATGDEFRAAVLLWCASWHQMPAASLPDDDEELANLCGYSRAMKDWAKVRKGAMRGWIACDDGRLYHPTVAAKANESWAAKLAQRARTKAATEAREAKRRAAQSSTHVQRDDQRDVDGTFTKGQGQGQGQGQGIVLGAAAPPSPADEAPSKPKAKGSRLPADWTPGESGEAFAQEQGLRNGRMASELAKFRDHWAAKTGQDASKADWQAAWRNWVRKAVEFAPKGAATDDWQRGAL